MTAVEKKGNMDTGNMNSDVNDIFVALVANYDPPSVNKEAEKIRKKILAASKKQTKLWFEQNPSVQFIPVEHNGEVRYVEHKPDKKKRFQFTPESLVEVFFQFSQDRASQQGSPQDVAKRFGEFSHQFQTHHSETVGAVIVRKGKPKPSVSHAMIGMFK
jgi:hypothetical protein